MTEQEICERLTDELNSTGFNGRKFCDFMAHQHRYLQEEFTKLCLKWIAKCGRDDYEYDGRNEWSHYVCKAIMRERIEDRIIRDEDRWFIIDEPDKSVFDRTYTEITD